MNNEQKEDLLWQIAKKRAGFKWSLASYVFVNAFLVGIWFFSAGHESHFWPIWPILGWGIGLAFQYIGAYHGNTMFSIESEYEKLKRQSSL